MRRFRFFLWNDFHLRNPAVPGRGPGYPGCNDKAAWAAACARGEVAGIDAPDFIATAGDLICGEIENYDDDFRYLGEHLLDPVDVPVLPCLGNHENRQGEGVEAQNAAYDRFFGGGWRNYVYTFGGIAFVVVDTSGAHRLADEVTAARNAFVERAFDHIGDAPAFLVTHVPLLPMRHPAALQPSFGFSSWRVLDDTLLQIVTGRRRQLIGVLCGHIHLTAVVEGDGVHHIMPSGTAGYPATFAALDVYDERVEVEMIEAPAALTPEPTRGDIHGARRHGIDYTDDEHPDHDSYLRGLDHERRLTIALDPARRPPPGAPPALQVEHEAHPGRWVPVRR